MNCNFHHDFVFFRMLSFESKLIHTVSIGHDVGDRGWSRRYTADNGPHTEGRDRQPFCALASTNGLRQCKASLYEGGIRVPGILEWPAKIKKNSQTWHPAYVSDYLPVRVCMCA